MVHTKIKITFAISEVLQRDLRENMIKQNYGLKDKSKWISEAIENLLMINNFPLLVSYSDEMSGFEKIETTVMNKSLKNKLDHAIVQIRKEYPTLEGVQSCIMRTAILQRLLRS